MRGSFEKWKSSKYHYLESQKLKADLVDSLVAALWRMHDEHNLDDWDPFALPVSQMKTEEMLEELEKAGVI